MEDLTPFCFVTGSGHQYFLQTVSELLSAVDAPRMQSAIFEDLPPTDEKLSLRWDPVEDRRYAMMWSDPTASGNKATTNWALNLLAYRGLQLFPAVPIGKKLGTTGFSVNDRQYEFSWPLWSVPLKCDTVRSLLASRDIQPLTPDRTALAARGGHCPCAACLPLHSPTCHLPLARDPCLSVGLWGLSLLRCRFVRVLPVRLQP